ncbi:hypothetical protein [Pararhodobacter sp.]|uniref:hypothetical protein n=1 Tax=Pararhodobacter sp. TaxID=2127056 RepID=UPI002AFF80B2|nr:hypothetical protein [Pararhodobacter sp.]
MASHNRAILYVQPLGTSQRLAVTMQTPAPAGAEIVAEMDDTGKLNGRYYGWMVRMPTGTYVHMRVGGGIVSLDQRKAQAALDRAEKIEAKAQEPAEDGKAQWAQLARDVAKWRGYLTTDEAAKTLGLSTRTLEGIEQGRGFRYPRLLRLAMYGTAQQPAPTQDDDA